MKRISKQGLNISLTTINLCILSAIFAYAVSTLGDDDSRFREHLLFRDGSTTVTGTLSAESGNWSITQDGLLHVKFINWEPITDTMTHSEMVARYGLNTQMLYRPGGVEISSASSVIRHEDSIWNLTSHDFLVYNPDYEYDFLIHDGEKMLISRSVY